MHYAPMVVSKTLVSWWIDAFWFLCIRSDAEFLLLFAQAVQLIKLDLDRLDKISKLCSGPKKIALEYFARANEIRFFPELDALQHWASLDLLDGQLSLCKAIDPSDQLFKHLRRHSLQYWFLQHERRQRRFFRTCCLAW